METQLQRHMQEGRSSNTPQAFLATARLPASSRPWPQPRSRSHRHDQRTRRPLERQHSCAAQRDNLGSDRTRHWGWRTVVREPSETQSHCHPQRCTNQSRLVAENSGSKVTSPFVGEVSEKKEYIRIPIQKKNNDSNQFTLGRMRISRRPDTTFSQNSSDSKQK